MAQPPAHPGRPPADNTPKPTRRVFEVSLEDMTDQPPEMQVVVLAPSGRLLAAAPVKAGKADLSLTDGQLRTARVFVAPLSPPADADGPNERLTSLPALERQQAYEAAIRPAPGATAIRLLPIPESFWKHWILCRCRVRGRVVKRLDLGNLSEERPVPLVRVHICEVDPLPWLIRRLPVPDLLRLRKELQRVLTRPPLPWPPDPEPDPWPILPALSDRLPEPLRRLARITLDPQPEPPAAWRGPLTTDQQLASREAALQDSWINPQPEPPLPAFSSLSSLPATSLAALSSSSPTVFREALLLHLDLLRPFLCLWPWLRHWLRCTEVAVVDTDAHGRFETTVHYPCHGDHPDLYFWVEAPIGGVWTTVHRPPLRCHTHWNYPCGSEVTIRIQDCRVPTAENPPTTLAGTKVHVIRIGGIYVSQIGADGLDPDGAPFAMDLRPYVEFGPDLLAAGISHYRWTYRRLTLADGSTSFTDGWHELEAPVVHHYTEVLADGTWRIVPYPIGPDPAVTTTHLYKIRPEDPPIETSSLTGWWTTYGVDEAISGVFNSHAADVPAAEALLAADGHPRVAGRFELRLELFRLDATGAPVAVTLPRDGFVIPPDPPVSGGVITPVVAPDAMVAKTDPADPASPVSAFLLTLRVDNYPTEAAIVTTTVGGTPANLCGMLAYPPGATATLAFQARHPNHFATFSFGVWRGSPGTQIGEASASGKVDAAIVNGFTRDPSGTFTRAGLPVATLLGTCSSAAFAENLYVYATATNGYRRIEELDRSATSAFALIPTAGP